MDNRKLIAWLRAKKREAAKMGIANPVPTEVARHSGRCAAFDQVLRYLSKAKPVKRP